MRVRTGSRLNQLRFRAYAQRENRRGDIGDAALAELHRTSPLVDGPLDFVRDGVVLRVALSADAFGGVVGYRAQKHTDVIDVDRIGAYRIDDWDRLRVTAEADSRSGRFLHPRLARAPRDSARSRRRNGPDGRGDGEFR